MINWTEKNVRISKLSPYERNPRKISEEAYQKLKSSLVESGYHQRIIATQDLKVIGGHQRIKVLKELGINEITVLIPDRELTSKEYQRILIQDNLSFGEFDISILNEDFEIGELEEWGLPDTLLKNMNRKNAGLTDPDEVPAISSAVVTKMGDTWDLGGHTLCCGDSTKADDVAALLGGVKPNLMVTDPPYGVNYDPTWRDKCGGEFGDGRTKMRGKVQNDNKMDWREAWALFPGNIAYVWHAGRHASAVQVSLESVEFEIRCQIVWVKPHFIMSRGDYHWQHEPCWYAVRNKGDWRGDRKQTTVWEIAGMNPAGGSKKAEDSHTNHGTQKPVECMKRPIENNSSPGQAVYEPFSGSGTTIIAAEMTGRICYAMELSPEYVDMAIIRWQNFTGKEAIHIANGKKFNKLQKTKKAA